MTVDLDRIERLAGGVLGADTLVVNCCDGCGNIHFYLKANGEIFATVAVAPEDGMLVAARVIEIHDHLAKRARQADEEFMSRAFPIPAPKNCLHCGVAFQPRAKYPQQRFCSRQCGLKATLPPDHNIRVARETAVKRGNTQRGRGAGKSYRKLNGRHEHRVIAEQKIGRPLLAGEVVHHDDNDKLNNDPSNLVVLNSQGAHASLYFKGRCKSPESIRKQVASRKANASARIEP